MFDRMKSLNKIRRSSRATRPAHAAASRDTSREAADVEGHAAEDLLTAFPGLADPSLEELAARQRRLRERSEAVHELKTLRKRYWSGERLLEESRDPRPWWSHPDADPYAVLDLQPGASLAEASRQRRRIALECHPDLHGETAEAESRRDAAARMKAANVAYERLRRAFLHSD